MKRRLKARKPYKSYGPVPFAERVARAHATRHARAMEFWMFRAFSDERMLENASLVVWTKGQMRGIRATLLRLGVGKMLAAQNESKH